MAENEFYKDKFSRYLLDNFNFIAEMNSAVFVTQAVLTVKIQYSMRINRPEEYKSKSLNKQTKNNVEFKPDPSTGIHPVLVTWAHRE